MNEKKNEKKHEKKLIDKLCTQYSHIIPSECRAEITLEKLLPLIIDYYEAIISCMPGNVYWLDKNCIGMGCNKNTLDMFGFKSQAEFKGLNYQAMGKIGHWSEDAISAFEQDSVEVITTGKPKLNVEETPIPNAQGKLIHFLTNRVPFSPSNQFIGLIGISVDITELKNMQKALETAKEKAEGSNRVKSQFLAVINHELRTPLVSILGLLDFLKQTDLPIHEEENILAAIKNCTHHLLELVNDISDFNKLETGKYYVRLDPVDLDNVVLEVYGMLKELARNKGLELCINTNSDTPKCIRSDQRILMQILMNIVSNAIKFTEVGRISISIRHINTQGNKVKLAFSVVDTGIGIAKDKLKLIFEPFHQLEGAYKRQSSRNGTGLGLTIVEKLANLIGASIAVKSKPGKGSEFIVTGVFELADYDQHFSTIKKSSFNKKPSILLIEDDPIVQYVHTKMLTNLNCDVAVAANGDEAMQIANKHDIIFVDISLPDMNGFEVIKKIRNHQKLSTPIVALTVYTGNEEKNASLNAGANEFASKPISQDRFQKILNKYL